MLTTVINTNLLLLTSVLYNILPGVYASLFPNLWPSSTDTAPHFLKTEDTSLAKYSLGQGLDKIVRNRKTRNKRELRSIEEETYFKLNSKDLLKVLRVISNNFKSNVLKFNYNKIPLELRELSSLDNKSFIKSKRLSPTVEQIYLKLKELRLYEKDKYLKLRAPTPFDKEIDRKPKGPTPTSLPRTAQRNNTTSNVKADDANYLRPHALRTIKDLCNPFNWYPKDIPEYCYRLQEKKRLLRDIVTEEPKKHPQVQFPGFGFPFPPMPFAPPMPYPPPIPLPPPPPHLPIQIPQPIPVPQPMPHPVPHLVPLDIHLPYPSINWADIFKTTPIRPVKQNWMAESEVSVQNKPLQARPDVPYPGNRTDEHSNRDDRSDMKMNFNIISEQHKYPNNRLDENRNYNYRQNEDRNSINRLEENRYSTFRPNEHRYSNYIPDENTYPNYRVIGNSNPIYKSEENRYSSLKPDDHRYPEFRPVESKNGNFILD